VGASGFSSDLGGFGSTGFGAGRVGRDRSVERGAWRTFGFERALGGVERGVEERGGRAVRRSFNVGGCVGSFTFGSQRVGSQYSFGNQICSRQPGGGADCAACASPAVNVS
jgi:hypothetical protein